MSECLLYAYQDGERTGLIEGISSLQWMPEWQSAGEFKLVCACSDKNLSLLTVWGLLYNPDTPDIAAVTTYVDKSINDEGKRVIEVRGEFTSRRWKERVLMGSIEETDAVSGILSICSDNLRDMDATIGTSEETASISYKTSWGQCYDAMCDMAEAGNIGFQHTFDPDTAGETLDILTGTDRSDQTSEDYIGYFGTMPQNVAAASITEDYSDYGNVVICTGEAPAEGDSFTQETVYVGATSSTGNDRKEIYVDGAEVTHTYQESDGQGGTTEKTYTDAEYTAALTKYATAALLNHMKPLTIKLDARNNTPTYGEDYGMGDALPIIIPGIGIRAKATVMAVKFIYEETGKSLELVFGNFETLD